MPKLIMCILTGLLGSWISYYYKLNTFETLATIGIYMILGMTSIIYDEVKSKGKVTYENNED